MIKIKCIIYNNNNNNNNNSYTEYYTDNTKNFIIYKYLYNYNDHILHITYYILHITLLLITLLLITILYITLLLNYNIALHICIIVYNDIIV